MVPRCVYLDNHATTRVDPRVVEAMLPYFMQHYGNAGSVSHSFGLDAHQAVEEARGTIAQAIQAHAHEIVFTSGATESNNLVLRGLADRRRGSVGHMVTVATEHRSVLDPLARLGQGDVDITLLPVAPHHRENAGRVDVDQLADALRDDTLLVSVMLVNNEIGVIQPLAEIAAVCRERGVLLHTDATQAVGKIPVDVAQLGVDLLSFSAHKVYGPKGVGALYVRRKAGRVRLTAQTTGGGQEQGLRSGTLNVPGIVGFARALDLCVQEIPSENIRLRELRRQLFSGLIEAVDGVALNGPALDRQCLRLPGNLNCRFAGIDGETLMLHVRDVAASSGSACSSAHPEPSHVLRALGLDVDQVRSSLRFGLGRYNNTEEIEFAVSALAAGVQRLRRLAPP